MHVDALVTAAEASAKLGDVSRHLIAWWVSAGHLEPRGKRGRSPLYRWGDVLAAEAATRNSRYSSRRPRQCREAA